MFIISYPSADCYHGVALTQLGFSGMSANGSRSPFLCFNGLEWFFAACM